MEWLFWLQPKGNQYNQGSSTSVKTFAQLFPFVWEDLFAVNLWGYFRSATLTIAEVKHLLDSRKVNVEGLRYVNGVDVIQAIQRQSRPLSANKSSQLNSDETDIRYNTLQYNTIKYNNTLLILKKETHLSAFDK